MDPEQLKNLLAETSKANTEMIALLTKQNEQVKQNGETSAALAAKIEQQGADYLGLKSELEEKLAKFAERQEEAERKAAERALASKRPGFDGGDEAKSIGAQFIEQFQDSAEAAKTSMLLGSKPTVAGKLSFAGGVKAFVRQMQRKANIVSSDATRFGGEMEDSILRVTRRGLRLRNLLRVVPTTKEAVSYIEQTGFMPNASVAISSITHVAGVATVTTGAAHGLRVGAVAKIEGSDQDGYNGFKRVISVVSSTVFTMLVDSGTVSPSTGTEILYNASRYGAAAGVAQGDAKPEAKMTFTRKTANIETIAHWIPAAKQILSDLPELQSMVDEDLIYGVLREEERQCFYGDGSDEFLGLFNNPNAQSLVGTGGSKLDLIRRAVTLVQLAELEADGVALAPEDWEGLETAKGSDGHYIWQLPSGPMQTGVWRLPVVVSTALDPLDFMVGAWGSGGATLYDREEANVLLSTEHSDFFVRNLVALLGEERAGFAVKRPEAFVKGDFGTSV